MNYRIEPIVRKLLIKYPDFSEIINNTRFIPSLGIQTACTDGEDVYYNPEFMNSLNKKQQLTILAHEICHIALNHIKRLGDKNRDVWNIATDAVINANLEKDGCELFNNCVKIEDALEYDSEELYEMLMEEYNKQKSNMEKMQQQSQQGQQGNQSQQGQQGNQNQQGEQGNQNQQGQQGNQSQQGQQGNQNQQGEQGNQNQQGQQGNQSQQGQQGNQSQQGQQGNQSQQGQQNQGRGGTNSNKEKTIDEIINDIINGENSSKIQNHDFWEKAKDNKNNNSNDLDEQSKNNQRNDQNNNSNSSNKNNDKSDESQNENSSESKNENITEKSDESQNEKTNKSKSENVSDESSDLNSNKEDGNKLDKKDKSKKEDSDKEAKKATGKDKYEKGKKDKEEKIERLKDKEKSKWEDEVEKDNFGEKDYGKSDKETFEQNRNDRLKKIQIEKEKLKQQLQSFGQGLSDSYGQTNIGEIGSYGQTVDWRRLLRESTTRDVDWTLRNAEVEDGIVLSRLEEFPCSETEIVLDTSGSVSITLLRNFLRECKNILKNSKIKVGCFDTRFYGFQEIKTMEDIENFQFKGFGGTDFDAAVNAFSKRVDNRIVFTDGYAPMPNKKVRAIWLVYGDGSIRPDGGKVIHITPEMLEQLNDRARVLRR